MKRVLFTLILVIGVAAAGYYGYRHFQAEQAGSGAVGALAHVPADTPFFFGALEARDWSEWLQRMPGGAFTPPPAALAELRDKLSGAGAAGGLLYGLYSLYFDLLADPLTIPARTGVRLDDAGMLYGIGLVPVMRQGLADPAVFTAFLDEAEQRGNISHQAGEFRGVPLRRYPFGDDSALELVVAVRDGVVIITLDTPVEREGVLALALELERPTSSLADTGLAHEVAERHGFDLATVGFINHRALVDGLIGNEGSRLARMLNALGANVEQQLAPLRTPGCRRDLQAIAERWPMTALGYTELKPQAGSATMEMVVVASDESQMQELLQLQGHIPPALRQGQAAPLAATAFGLDVDALAPSVQSLWQRFTSADYQCEFLVAAQQELRQQNPAMLALGTAMLSGIRGVAVAVYDLQVGADGPQLDTLRAVLTLSAEDPAAVLSRVQALNPNLAALRIPADGSAVELPPLFEQQGLPPLLAAIHGQHLVIFTGSVPDGVLPALAAEPLSANGLWWMRLDYARLFPLLERFIASAASKGAVAAEEAALVQEQFGQLGTLNMAAEFGLDFSGKGVILRSGVEVGADQAQNQ